MLESRFIDSQTQLHLDIYINSLDSHHQPEYIIEHHQELLPDWRKPPQTIIFIFFECKCSLDGNNLRSEQLEKDRLFVEFYNLASDFYDLCQNQGIISEIICPKDGVPLHSQKGKDIFNICAIVNRQLSSFQQENTGCGLIHPCSRTSVCSITGDNR